MKCLNDNCEIELKEDNVNWCSMDCKGQFHKKNYGSPCCMGIRTRPIEDKPILSDTEYQDLMRDLKEQEGDNLSL